MIYAVDLDFFKLVMTCHAVDDMRWRVSSSGKGFHFSWRCRKRRCKHCRAVERRYDDPRRQRRDRKRKPWQRRVLWDRKGNKRAALWHEVKL